MSYAQELKSSTMYIFSLQWNISKLFKYQIIVTILFMNDYIFFSLIYLKLDIVENISKYSFDCDLVQCV